MFQEQFEKIKIILIIKTSNLIKLLVSIISHYSQRFSGIFIVKTTFEEFAENCEQIHRKLEIQYNDENEKIDSNIDLLANFF